MRACVCVFGSLCVAADASLTLPNFKSSVSTLIFPSPALQTQGIDRRERPKPLLPLPSLFFFYCSTSQFSAIRHPLHHLHTLTSSLSNHSAPTMRTCWPASDLKKELHLSVSGSHSRKHTESHCIAKCLAQ